MNNIAQGMPDDISQPEETLFTTPRKAPGKGDLDFVLQPEGNAAAVHCQPMGGDIAAMHGPVGGNTVAMHGQVHYGQLANLRPQSQAYMEMR